MATFQLPCQSPVCLMGLREVVVQAAVRDLRAKEDECRKLARKNEKLEREVSNVAHERERERC